MDERTTVPDDEARHYRPRRPGRLFTIGWVVAVLAIIVVTAALTLARELQIRRDTERREQELAQGRRVVVTRPRQLPPTRTLEVPAAIRAWSETPVYAKVSGYLRKVYVDKGDRVRAGQPLAELESPEIDQQVANARANYELQVATNRRNRELVRQGIVARQAADESEAALLQAKATLEQLIAMQSYETIRAPFDGIVAVRNVDPGTLVPQATTSGSSPSTPILIMGTISPVRVYAEVPQSAAPDVRVGDPATVRVRELPDREFTGTVARRADALDPATRTMRVEVDVPNDDGALLSGMYARATFTVALRGGTPQVPTDALVFRRGKVYVPVVRHDRLNLAEVTLGFDDGRTVEVTSGIAPDDLVALNVGQAVRDGETVQPVPAGDD